MLFASVIIAQGSTTNQPNLPAGKLASDGYYDKEPSPNTQGVTGSTGTSGSKGMTGSSGNTSGYTGNRNRNKGTTGISGPKGITGKPGGTGNPGPQK